MANKHNKELRLKYQKSGIYTITNLVNGKMYVGYTTNFTDRKSQHFTTLENQNHKNKHLQNAFNKYGKESFIFEILEECEYQFLTSQEHYWTTILSTHNRKYGYNQLPTNPNTGVNKGYKNVISEEGRRKRKENYIFTPALQVACKESIKKAQEAIKIKGRTREHTLNHVKSKSKNYRQIQAFNIKDGTLFGTYDLMSEASEATNTGRSSIHNNVHGISKCTKNFIFKYKDL